MSQTKNRLHSLLPRVQPELVQFMRDDIPQWVLAVLERYPTAPQLARAKAETLARIPYVTAARAKELIAAARQSVGAQTDTFSAATVAFLFALSLLLEHWSVERARNAIGALLALSPPTARYRCPEHGDLHEKPVEEVPLVSDSDCLNA